MSEYTTEFLSKVTNLLKKIEGESSESINKAASKMAEAIEEDELIHVIGPGGHSNMGAEEMFWRAGGLVPINPILDAGTALIHGAKRSNRIERTPGYAEAVFDSYDIKSGVLIIVNAYGINAMAIDCAKEAEKRNLTSIGVTSTSFADKVPDDHTARHPSGEDLYNLVDIFVNCHMPYGDALVEFEEMEQNVAPSSTLVNTFTVNLLTVKTVEILLEENFEPPIWMSANLPGGDEANRKYEEKFKGRVEHL